MILSILSIINSIILVGTIYYLLRRGDKLEARLNKNVLDIKSLQRNQNVLVSTIKELYRELRKRDKSLKRQLRTGPGNQETRSEEI